MFIYRSYNKLYIITSNSIERFVRILSLIERYKYMWNTSGLQINGKRYDVHNNVAYMMTQL